MKAFLDEYEAGAGRLREAVAGLTREQLLKRPADGSWSIQQIVLHMMDSELIVTDRAKRIIAEPEPQIIGFDERLYVANLHYEQQEVEDALVLIAVNRRQFARVLRHLSPATLDEVGFHNERGEMTLRQVLNSLNSHFQHHLEFILKKRPRP